MIKRELLPQEQPPPQCSQRSQATAPGRSHWPEREPARRENPAWKEPEAELECRRGVHGTGLRSPTGPTTPGQSTGSRVMRSTVRQARYGGPNRSQRRGREPQPAIRRRLQERLPIPATPLWQRHPPYIPPALCSIRQHSIPPRPPVRAASLHQFASGRSMLFS